MLVAVMMSPRERWTDERLDDLNEKVDRGFTDLKVEMKAGFERMESRLGERFDAVDQRFEKIDERFEKVDQRFEKVDERFEKVDERLHDLNRILLGAAAVIIATLLGALLT
jgi:hypothetical protein